MAYNNNQTTKSSKRPRNYNDSAPRKGKNYGKKYDKASKYFDGPEYLKKKISNPLSSPTTNQGRPISAGLPADWFFRNCESSANQIPSF